MARSALPPSPGPRDPLSPPWLCECRQPHVPSLHAGHGMFPRHPALSLKAVEFFLWVSLGVMFQVMPEPPQRSGCMGHGGPRVSSGYALPPSPVERDLLLRLCPWDSWGGVGCLKGAVSHYC